MKYLLKFENVRNFTEEDLIDAIKNKYDFEKVELILKDKKINVNFYHKYIKGSPALLYAVGEPTSRPINSNDNYDYTKLSPISKLKIVQLLLKNGADPNSNNGHLTALEMASHQTSWCPPDIQLLIVKELLKYGADPKNALILQCSVNNYNIEIIKELIKSKININATDKLGRTALMEAIMRDNLNIVILLIKAGADLTIKDNQGKSSLDWCWSGSKSDKWLRENFGEYFSAKKYNL